MRFPIALMILIGTAVPALADMESARNAMRAGNPAEMTALAASGDNDAQLLLAEAYMAAAGVARDPAQAVIWAKKAATQGNLLAQVMLAQVFGRRHRGRERSGRKCALAENGGSSGRR